METNTKEALSIAVKAIYFDDSSDYLSALWEIVNILGGNEAAELLENDESKAFEKYAEND